MDELEILENGATQSKVLGRYDLLACSGVRRILDFSPCFYADDILTPLVGAGNIFSNSEIEDRSFHACQNILVAIDGITKELLAVGANISDSLAIIAEVVGEGSKKYGAWNWQGIPVESHLNHAIKHYILYVQGDRSEPHLEHILTRCFFALSLFS